MEPHYSLKGRKVVVVLPFFSHKTGRKHHQASAAAGKPRMMIPVRESFSRQKQIRLSAEQAVSDLGSRLCLATESLNGNACWERQLLDPP